MDASESGDASSLQDAFAVGSIVEAAKVIRVESESGLIVEVSDGLQGFVHVRPVFFVV